MSLVEIRAAETASDEQLVDVVTGAEASSHNERAGGQGDAGTERTLDPHHCRNTQYHPRGPLASLLLCRY